MAADRVYRSHEKACAAVRQTATRRHSHRRVGFIAAIALVAHGAVATVSLVADAQAGASDARRAERLMQSARAAFLAARYAEAARDFRAAYDASQQPALLFNIGVCEERLGNRSAAIELFEQYLARATDASDRLEVEQRIARLRVDLDEARQSTPSLQAPQPGTPSPPRSGSLGLSERANLSAPGATLAPGIIVTTVGGAALAAGALTATLGASALARVDQAPTGSNWADYRDDAARGVALSNTSIALVITGVVCTGVGIPLWISAASRSRPARVSISPVPGGAVLAGWF